MTQTSCRLPFKDFFSYCPAYVHFIHCFKLKKISKVSTQCWHLFVSTEGQNIHTDLPNVDIQTQTESFLKLQEVTKEMV
jgi:hypothetical protein